MYQAPTNTQSVNPYSYVMNNPLSLTDPSGYCASAADNVNDANPTVCGKGDNDAGNSVYQGHNNTGSMDRLAGSKGSYLDQLKSAAVATAGLFLGAKASLDLAAALKNMPNGASVNQDALGKFVAGADVNSPAGRDNQPHGTFFFGGAGMNGTYISDMVKDMKSAGINDARAADTWAFSSGTAVDAFVGVDALRNYDPEFGGEILNRDSKSTQFNLVGYSYGSLVAAQEAMYYANKGAVVDHLVLIGSPISQEFLGQLRDTVNIRNVTVINLTEHGDPIYAGMGVGKLNSVWTVGQLASQQQTGTGHFYYAPDTPEGHGRRVDLANELFSDGLR
jgi:hypothetical protein